MNIVKHIWKVGTYLLIDYNLKMCFQQWNYRF